MRSNQKMLTFFLCFLTLRIAETFPDTFEVFRDNAKKYGITSKVVGQNESIVYIKNKPYEIHIYDPVDDKSTQKRDETDPTSKIVEKPLVTKRDFYDNTLHKLFISINCEFAEWTRDKLLKMLETYPSLYQQQFQTINDKIYLNYCKNSGTAFNYMIKNIQRFIDILLNFQKIYLSVHDTSIDTDVLTSFLVLIFKMDFLNGLCVSSSQTHVSDVLIIRVLLESLNSFQRFSYFHCKLSTYYDNKILYGFFMNEDDTKDKTIELFFNDIQQLNLESPRNCNAKQMILLDMISRGFGDTTWKMTNGTVLFKDILPNIEKSYDTSILFWYQKYVLDMIIKFLFIKAREYFMTNPQQCLSDNEVTYFESIYSILIFSVHNLPSDLIECLSLLAEKIKGKYCVGDHEFINTITKYINSISTVQFNKTVILIQEENDIIHVNDNVDNIPISTLNQFIRYLNENSEELKCFVRLFEFLRNKSDTTYFMPFSNDEEKVALFEQEISAETANKIQSTSQIGNENDVKTKTKLDQARKYNNDELNIEGCNFFGGLYHFCVTTSIDLNYALEFNTTDDSNKEIIDYYSRIKHTMHTIKQCILNLINKYEYTPHMKLVLHILPLIHTKHETFFAKEHYEELKRLVFVIMTLLNDYSIEYCIPPKRNFLFFNNMDFDNFGQADVIHQNIVNSMDRLSKKSQKVSSSKLAPLPDLIQVPKHPKNEIYEDLIKLSWKGEKKSRLYIHKNITNGLVNTYDVIALVEYSLKFCIGVLYYKLHMCSFENVNDKTKKKVTELFAVHLKHNELPENRFKTILNDLEEYISKVAFYETETIQEHWRNKLYEELESIGVFVDRSELKISQLIKNELPSIKDTISEINDLAVGLTHYSGYPKRSSQLV